MTRSHGFRTKDPPDREGPRQRHADPREPDRLSVHSPRPGYRRGAGRGASSEAGTTPEPAFGAAGTARRLPARGWDRSAASVLDSVDAGIPASPGVGFPGAAGA